MDKASSKSHFGGYLAVDINNNPTAPKMLTSAQRRIQALELRKAGYTYEQIGAALGITDTMAHKHVVKALGIINEKLSEATEELRTLEVHRIDAMIVVLWPRVLRGDYQAIDRVVKLMERRAKLLGLDAPTKQIVGMEGSVSINFVDIVNGSEPD